MMSKYASFSKKQVAYIRKSGSCWLNIAEGGKRAGKNIINIIAFAMNIELSPDKLHLAAGVTHGTARMNIIDSNGFGLKNYFNGRCRTGMYEGVDALFIQTATGDKVVLIAGGQKINDAARIKDFHHPKCIGIDLNSRFETEPGMKDIGALREFLSELNIKKETI
jgi:phosphoribosylanthranilate isomerase